jgi:hypothetical protein
MLRLTLIFLLLANGLYFAWSQNYFALLGFAPATQTEPARMQAQIKPEAIRLLGNAEARRADAAAASPPNATAAAAKPAECLQSPVLDTQQANKVRSAASTLPSASWTLDNVTVPARWIIYMGKYPSAEALAKKKAELRELDVDFQTLQNSELEPGVSLGNYATQALATQELADLNKRGVRTAKVVQEKPATTGQVLRLPAVDDALRTQLGSIRTALGSATLQTCKNLQ